MGGNSVVTVFRKCLPHLPFVWFCLQIWKQTVGPPGYFATYVWILCRMHRASCIHCLYHHSCVCPRVYCIYPPSRIANIMQECIRYFCLWNSSRKCLYHHPRFNFRATLWLGCAKCLRSCHRYASATVIVRQRFMDLVPFNMVNYSCRSSWKPS